MGNATAGTWVIFLSLYFIVFSILMTNAIALDDTLSQSGGINDVSLTDEGCYAPRYAYNNNGELNELLGGAKRSDYCYTTLGVNNENICTSLEGCTWTNQTSCFLFFSCETNIQTCEGRLNQTHYGYTTSDLDINSGLCGINATQNNKTLCESLGCSYGRQESSINQDDSKASVFGVMYSMFTFNADIGMPTAFEYVFILLFVYFPAIILLLAIYFSLPIIH